MVLIMLGKDDEDEDEDEFRCWLKAVSRFTGKWEWPLNWWTNYVDIIAFRWKLIKFAPENQIPLRY